MSESFKRLFMETVLPSAAQPQQYAVIGNASLREATISAATLAALSQQYAPSPKEPLTDPVFGKAPLDRKGMLSHISPIHDSFLNVQRDLLDLRSKADTGRNQAGSLIDRISDFLDDHLQPDELRRLGIIPDEGSAVTFRLRMAPDLHTAMGKLVRPRLDHSLAKPGERGSGDTPHNDESALFSAGKAIADDIGKIEALRGALINLRRRHQQTLEDQRARLAALETEIREEIRQLDISERERAETLDDYALAQRLLAEHWREVENAHAERRRIIENHLGLFYVKVRETPLGRTLPDPLDLRPSSPDDLVPGCTRGEAALPAALLPFMRTVHAIPSGDWASLRPLEHLLPGRAVLSDLVEARRHRLTLQLNLRASASSFATPVLAELAQQNDALVHDIAQRPFNATVLSDLQRQAGTILALQDLLSMPAPQLSEPAHKLHQRLDAAAGCLLSRLRAMSPSIRLDWAAAAEANRLAVDMPERWPGLASAEANDFNGVRTLLELVSWFFRQLHADASTGSHTAMRNLVRACILLAASDDPQQLIQGSLKTIPHRFRLGDALRLTLNREATPGSLLHLFDDHQRVIATLRVDDHDEHGTVASVANILDPRLEREPGTVISTMLRVSGVNRS